MGQRLITRKEFFQLGIAKECIPEELVLEPASETSTIEMWISYASARVLAKLAPIVYEPVLDWGDDVRGWVAAIAVEKGKNVSRLPANDPAYAEIMKAAADARTELGLIYKREDCPASLVDSRPKGAQPATQLKIIGYARTSGLPEF